MQAIHAVVEMALASGPTSVELSGRFRALCRRNTGSTSGSTIERQHGFWLAVTRVLHLSVRALVRPPSDTPQTLPSVASMQAAVATVMRDLEPEAQQVTQLACECRTLPDFIRAVGYGADRPASPEVLGVAAAAVLRAVLRSQGNHDPMRRWVTLAQITNAALAAHYLK